MAAAYDASEPVIAPCVSHEAIRRHPIRANFSTFNLATAERILLTTLSAILCVASLKEPTPALRVHTCVAAHAGITCVTAGGGTWCRIVHYKTSVGQGRETISPVIYKVYLTAIDST